ncbi:hypothetical protein [Tritonibacter mobilis]|uniref:DUF7697 family protein n=1 Tax=Tritonibacter mobilis TaxID=379347 RepID=UPI0039A6BDDB
MAGLSARVIGYDMTAALALGEAMGLDRFVVAEFLPHIEQIAVSKMNEQEPSPDES